METVINIFKDHVQGFYLWSFAVIIVLAIIPSAKIKAIGDFFKKVIPTIPFTGMISAARGKKKDE